MFIEPIASTVDFVASMERSHALRQRPTTTPAAIAAPIFTPPYSAQDQHNLRLRCRYRSLTHIIAVATV
jgi:hypothetical protein